MASYIFDDSDNENKSNIQNYTQEAFILKEEKIPFNSEISGQMFQQESYVKEELIISETDFSDSEAAKNHEPILQISNIELRSSKNSKDNSENAENIAAEVICDPNSDDEEIDVVNTSKDIVIMSHQTMNDVDSNENIDYIRDTSGHILNKIMEDNEKVDESSSENELQSPTNEKVSMLLESSKRSLCLKQTTIFNYFKKSLPKDKEAAIAVSNSVVPELSQSGSKLQVIKTSSKHKATSNAKNTTKIKPKDSSPIQKAKCSIVQQQQLILKSLRKSSVRIERLPQRNTAKNTNETRAAVIKISARDAIAQVADDKKEIISSISILVCPNCASTKKSCWSKTYCSTCRERMYHECLQCNDYQTISASSIVNHARLKCGGPNFYHCDHCDYRNRIKDNIRRHIQAEHSVQHDENGMVECGKCGGRYKGRDNLQKHKRLCGLGTFLKCELCKMQTRYRSSLKKHLQRVHNTLRAKEIERILNRALKKEHDVVGNRGSFATSALKSTNNKIEATAPKRFYLKDFIKLYCPSCDDTFQRHTFSERKCPRCTKPTLLQCLKCEKRYESSGSMNLHVKSKCGPKEYFQCAECEYQVVSKRRLLMHIRRRHTKIDLKDYEKCAVCSKGFKHRVDRQRHERVCGKDIQCEFCPYKGTNRAYFERHVQNHIWQSTIQENDEKLENPGNTSNFIDKPSFISKPMSKKEKLRVQKLIKVYCSKCKKNIIPAIRQIKCRKCKTKFTYNCDACDKSHSTRVKLRNHIAAKHLFAELKKRQQCLGCNKKFILPKDLHKHRYVCGRPSNLQCDHCAYKTKYKVSLANHMRNRHSAIIGLERLEPLPRKICVCDKCGRNYAGIRGLVRHKQIYCGKKPTLQCEHCHHKSYKKQNLIIHLNANHARKGEF